MAFKMLREHIVDEFVDLSYRDALFGYLDWE
jgi:hypothetical protein